MSVVGGQEKEKKTPKSKLQSNETNRTHISIPWLLLV